MNTLSDTYTLNDGNTIPCVGYGTWQTPDGQTTIDSVKEALNTGYRHIDAAAAYANEIDVGKGIKESKVNRHDIWITSKVPNTARGYEKTIAACEKTIQDLGLDYLDMYLIHWPASKKQFPQNWKKINQDTWSAFEELRNSGKVKTIGVCNCQPMHLEAILETAKIIPAVNQIEFHPGYTQDETVKFCIEHSIQIEAWSPLGGRAALSHPVIIEIAKKIGQTEAQVILRWCLQQNVLPLSKSVTPSRIKSNARVFNFNLSDADMQKISAISDCGFTGNTPETVTF